jgi:cytochrome P450
VRNQLNDRGSTDWHEIPVKQNILSIVARFSSRIFLGLELCRNPKWVETSVGYVMAVFRAIVVLSLWPKILVPIVHWYIPECQNARARLREARQILQPLIERRAEQASAAHGQATAPGHLDSLTWLEEAANGQTYDPVAAQLSLAIVSIYSSTDLLTQAIYDICQHQDLIEALRVEARSAVAAGSWKKPEISKLKLMDSVLKESQRIKADLGSPSFYSPSVSLSFFCFLLVV